MKTEETKAFYEGDIVALWEKVWSPAKGHLHMALFDEPERPIHEAMAAATEMLAAPLLLSKAKVVEVACGLGATARQLAGKGARVHASNLSATQVDQARAASAAEVAAGAVTYEVMDFHALAYPDAFADVYWNQEALVHAADRPLALREARRVLKPDGRAVFSVLTLSDEIGSPLREAIYERVHAPSMWSTGRYRDELKSAGFAVEEHGDFSTHVAPTYAWVRGELVRHRALFLEIMTAEKFAGMVAQFALWIDQAQAGQIGWHAFHCAPAA